jgi:hypothetical protein
MRKWTLASLVLALGTCTHLLADPASNSDQLLKAKQEARKAHQVADQLKDLHDDQFIAKCRELEVVEDDTVDWDSPGARPDIESLTKDINIEITNTNNLISDGFDANHPRVVSMRAEIAMKEKQRHGLIEKLKRRLFADAQTADERVKILEAGYQPTTLTPH